KEMPGDYKEWKFESSEHGRCITEYPNLSLKELDGRIRSYERKYGMSFPRYNRQFSCDDALPWETSDLMDWENLVREKAVRKKTSKADISSHCAWKLLV